MPQIRLDLEPLETRNTPSIVTAFDPATGFLVVQGDQADDTIRLSTGDSGAILLNGSAIPDGPTIANTNQIIVLGGAGNDRIDLQALTGFKGIAGLFGETGNDTILGSPSNDVLVGGDGNDQLFGGGSDDILLGGAGNDVLDGGTGQDWIFGEDGDDQLLGGGIDGVTDYFWGGAGRDIFVIEPSCNPWPEQEVLDQEVGDLFAVVYYFRDPCEDHDH